MGHIARSYIVVAAASVLVSSEAMAKADWIHLTQLNWEIELEYKGRNAQQEGVGEVKQYQFNEKIELSQAGYLISPKIFDFSLSLTPSFLQGQVDAANLGQRTEGVYFDYDVNLGVLHGAKAPVDFAADASRGTGTISGSLGSVTDFVLESRSVGTTWKLTSFPMSLRYEEQLRDQSFRSGPTARTINREDFQQSVRWQARSSKLQIQVEKRWFDDRVGDNDYQLLDQKVHHKLRWGKNSQLTTRQSYYDRAGQHSFTRYTVSEGLRLQHVDSLQSLIDYHYSSITQDDETLVTTVGYTLKFQPSTKFSIGLKGEGRDSTFGTGSEKEYGGRLDLTYEKSLFKKGKLSFGLRGSSLQTDRQSNGSTTETLEITRVVPATLIVLLDARAIDTSSIFLTDALANQVFVEGVDYIIRNVSGDRTELQILTSGQIAAGDTILVSYGAAAQPSAEFNTETVDANLTLDFDWLRLYHSSRYVAETLQSGSFGEGQDDQRDQTSGAQLSLSKAWVKATARAETWSHKSGDFSTKSLTYSQTVQVDISAVSHLFFSASQISFESDGRETAFNQWDLNLKWSPLRGMSVKPYVNGWDREDDLGQDERRLGAGVNFTWKLRQFDLALDYSHLDYVTPNSDRSEQRVGVRIVRRSK